MLVAAVSDLGATNLVVYLVDFEQRLLEPIRDQSAQSALAETEEVGVSVAGRAFVERQAQVVERPDGTRVWVPIVEGSDPTGVLALTVPAINDETMRVCEELGVLAGYLDRHPRPSHRSVQPASPPSGDDAGRQHAVGSAPALTSSGPAGWPWPA